MTTLLSRPGPAGDPGGPPLGANEAPASSRADDRESTARWDVEIALAFLTVAGLYGFHRVFSGSGWIVPVIGSALGVQVVCRLTRRYVTNPMLAGLIDLLSIGALTVWTVIPSSTTAGLPLRATWRAVHRSLAGVTNQMQSATVPTHPTTGFLLLAALGAGFVALAGSWIVFRLGRVLAAALPSLAAFVICSTLGTHAGRGWSTVLEIVATAMLVAVAGVRSRARSGWFAAQHDGAARRGLGAGIPAIALALLAALVVTAGAPAADGHGLFGWRAGDAGAARGVFSPLVSLSTRLLPQQSGVHVFTAYTPVRTYWRLTSLGYFDGNSWIAKDTYEGVDRTLPTSGTVRAPRGTRVVEEHIVVENLGSPWLPLAFDPKTVNHAGPVSYDALSDSLITPKFDSDGLNYTVTSLQYLATLSPRVLAAAPPLRPSKATAPYVELPTSVSPRVRALARTITAGDKTEYARALALQQYFYGPQFTYSLHPPTDGAGNAALGDFLFRTHTGYCQQFAGSYAVLARAIGLPTRLAVGFTSGRQVGANRYQVTNADAHTWPEVWFPDHGWVPFEPTKGSPGEGFAIPGATGYTGNTASVRATGPKGTTGPRPTPTTVPTPVTTPSGVAGHPTGSAHLRGPQPDAAGAGQTVNASAHPHHALSGRRLQKGHLLIMLGVLAAALAVWMAVNVCGRRARWRHRRHAGGRIRTTPRARVSTILALWEETTERLAWRRVRRGGSETPMQFAGRVAAERHVDGDIPFGVHLARLAEILTAAEFGERNVSEVDVAEAEARSVEIARVLRRDRSRAERARLLLDPRLAWAPRTVGPLATMRAARA